MLVREYKVVDKKDLEEVLDLIEMKLHIRDSKFKYRYIHTIQLITGSRLITISGRCDLLEITTDKTITIYQFKSMLELDLYVLNRFWINLNSFNTSDMPIIIRRKYDVVYARSIIKKVYLNCNSWWNKIFETREDLDLSNIKCYDSPYIRCVNDYKANIEIKELTSYDISKIFKIDNNKFIINVGKNKYKYAVYIDGDLYIGMYHFKLDDEFVKRLLVDARSLLKGVFNKALDKAYGIADEYRCIMIHQTDTLFIMSYDNSKVVYNKLMNGSLKFKINNKDRGIEDC